MIEPLIHSHLTDVLPEDNPLHDKTVYCDVCHKMVHCENNECMTTWVEVQIREIECLDGKLTFGGNFCIKCFAALQNVEIMMIPYREELEK